MIGSNRMQPQPPPGQAALAAEHVVLLDEAGHAIGTADKVAVHTSATPLHLAFSCYIRNESGAVLMTRRALDKRVFPGVWTNSVCGHPAAREGLVDAVRRRADFELELELSDLRLALPGFRYRAQMAGIVENEACPVLTARAIGDPTPNPVEVGDWTWVPWPIFVGIVLGGDPVADLRASDGTGISADAISPWCRLQVAALVALGPDPDSWAPGNPDQLPPALPPW